MFRAGGIPRGVPALAAGVTYLADISEFQSDISDPRYLAWSKAIIIRAMYGDAHDDAAWYGGARRADLHAGGAEWLGIYQYLVAGQDAAAQAHALVHLLGDLREGEIPICDLEEGSGDQAGRWAEWRAVIEDAYPQLKRTPSGGPWLYSGLDFAAAHGLHPQWVAAYQGTPPAMPHVLWQFSDSYPVPGVGIADCSLFNGSVAELRALITPKPAPKPKPDPKPTPAPAPALNPEDLVIEFDTVRPHALLPPYGSASMDLLTTAPESAPLNLEVTWMDQGGNPVGQKLSWGSADSEAGVTIPKGVKKGRIDYVSGGGEDVMLGVRFDQAPS